MPSNIARSRVKDSGASQASIYLASDSPPENPPQDATRDFLGARPDCSRHLLHKRRFRDAAKPHSVISFENWSPEEFAAIHPILLRSISRHPSSFVLGEDKFLTGDSPDEGRSFLIAAGFSEPDCDRLLVPGWSSLLV